MTSTPPRTSSDFLFLGERPRFGRLLRPEAVQPSNPGSLRDACVPVWELIREIREIGFNPR